MSMPGFTAEASIPKNNSFSHLLHTTHLENAGLVFPSARPEPHGPIDFDFCGLFCYLDYINERTLCDDLGDTGLWGKDEVMECKQRALTNYQYCKTFQCLKPPSPL